jgi:putative transposase
VPLGTNCLVWQELRPINKLSGANHYSDIILDMQQVLTIVCKINPTSTQVVKIDATLKAFADACNYINDTVDPKLTNNVRIQTLVYKQVREQFGLSANLAIRAINRVAGNRKTAKKDDKPVLKFKPTSADYDARIFAFRESDWTVSLTLSGGRERFKLQLGNYQTGKLTGSNPTSATLAKHRDGSYSVNIQVKTTAPDIKASNSVIGCDLGRTDICVTSTGDKHSGKQITQTRNKYAKTRSLVQTKATKGTRSSRRSCHRLLARLSGREKRFQSWHSHKISRQLVEQAKESNSVIALEDLTGIRERTNKQPKSPHERRLSNNWAFAQLRQYITYKALGAGVKVVLIPPAYTSKTCHKCNHIHPNPNESYRHGKYFRCGHCLWSGDADVNASVNIQKWGVTVNTPEQSSLSCLVSLVGQVESPRYIAIRN